MTQPRKLALLLVIAHWIVAIWHLFPAAKILPAPDNHVSWLAIVLLTLLHLGASIVLWKLSDRFTGLVSLIFFLTALSADLYEHFLHAAPNNVFMASPGAWTAWFDASVFLLLALEILGCLLGIRSISSWVTNSSPARESNANLSKTGRGRSSSQQYAGI